MPWKKTPPETIAAFDEAVPDDRRVTRRPMFGYPALYVNGNMFAGTYQESVVVRLAEADRSALMKAGGRQFEPMPGRPMKEYVVVPPATVAKPAALRKWTVRALAHAAALPAKGAATQSSVAKPAAKAKRRG